MSFLGGLFKGAFKAVPKLLGGLFRGGAKKTFGNLAAKAATGLGKAAIQQGTEAAADLARKGGQELIEKSGIGGVPVVGNLLKGGLQQGLDAGIGAGQGAAQNYFQK
jgi:hypothetical protein